MAKTEAQTEEETEAEIEAGKSNTIYGYDENRGKAERQIKRQRRR